MTRKRLAYATTLSIATITLLSVTISPISYAFSLTMSDGASSARGTGQATSLFGATGIVTTVSNVMLFIIGALSVVMIIIGGLRYVISGGNTGNVTAAKNTILYAVVGLVIAVMAYAIINFVITTFMPGGTGGSVGTNV
jgi:hypothetical protein